MPQAERDEKLEAIKAARQKKSKRTGQNLHRCAGLGVPTALTNPQLFL